MNNSIIQDKLKDYNTSSIEQETNAIKEIVQEIILYGLSTTGFFDQALFQGGTALRILYGLQRFSEDMDFILKKKDSDFAWHKYIESIMAICEEYGIIANVTDKSKANSSIQRLFIKDDSIGKLIDLSFKHQHGLSLTIKLEIDVNPPLGSSVETKYLDFPLVYAIQAQDLSSNFACKSHALLCRPYVKGRDWYDFIWYVSKKIIPNLSLFQNAIDQAGPWEKQKIKVTSDWYISQLKNKINEMDWVKAKADVERFLNDRDRQQLSLWSKELFMDRVHKLEKYMQGDPLNVL
jgi:predicted nucleotidyltransferase component of viral defense system